MNFDPMLLLMKRRKKIISLICSFVIPLIIIHYIYINHLDILSDQTALGFFFYIQYPGTSLFYNIVLLLLTINLFSKDYIKMNKSGCHSLILHRIYKRRYNQTVITYNFIVSFIYIFIIHLFLLTVISLFYCPLSINDLLSTSLSIISLPNFLYFILYIFMSALGYAVIANFIFIISFKIKKGLAYLFVGILTYLISFIFVSAMSAMTFRMLHNRLLAYLINLLTLTNMTNPLMYQSIVYAEGNLPSLTLVLDYILSLLLFSSITLFIFKRYNRS